MKKPVFFALAVAACMLLVFTAAGIGYGESATLSFSKKSFAGGQMLPVYNGPGYEYMRPTGYAKVSTDETIWMAGRKGDWALIMYQKNSGGFRTGWIDASELKYRLGGKSLYLANRAADITKFCELTDDPKNRSYTLANLYAGDRVTYMASYSDHGQWAYIEAWSGQLLCGFVPIDCLSF